MTRISKSGSRNGKAGQRTLGDGDRGEISSLKSIVVICEMFNVKHMYILKVYNNVSLRFHT